MKPVTGSNPAPATKISSDFSALSALEIGAAENGKLCQHGVSNLCGTDLHQLSHRAVQTYALKEVRQGDSLWATEMELQERLVGLSDRTDDLVWAFDQLAKGDLTNPALRKDWCDLVQLAWARDGLDPTVREAADRFRRNDKELEAFLRGLENPEKPAWKKTGAERRKA